MKTMINILIVFLLGFVCISCNPTNRSEHKNDREHENKKNNFYNLKISLDTTFDFGVIESKTLLIENHDTSHPWTYDSISKITSQSLDSLTPGNYIFEIKTIFRQDKYLTFRSTLIHQ